MTVVLEWGVKGEPWKSILVYAVGMGTTHSFGYIDKVVVVVVSHFGREFLLR